jgi:hypothetical protein
MISLLGFLITFLNITQRRVSYALISGQLLFLERIYGCSFLLQETLIPFVIQLLFSTLVVTRCMGKQDSKIIKKVYKNELKIWLIS